MCFKLRNAECKEVFFSPLDKFNRIEKCLQFYFCEEKDKDLSMIYEKKISYLFLLAKANEILK